MTKKIKFLEDIIEICCQFITFPLIILSLIIIVPLEIIFVNIAELFKWLDDKLYYFIREHKPI